LLLIFIALVSLSLWIDVFREQVWSNPHSVPSEAGPHFDDFASARFLGRDHFYLEFSPIWWNTNHTHMVDLLLM
jgi:hypothetical protein